MVVITTITDHYHYRSLPLQITTITDHYHYRSLPLQITTITDHYHYRSLPLQITTITNHYHYRSLPLQITTITDHYHYRSLPLLLGDNCQKRDSLFYCLNEENLLISHLLISHCIADQSTIWRFTSMALLCRTFTATSTASSV